MSWGEILAGLILAAIALVLRWLVRSVAGTGECAGCFTPVPDGETWCEECGKGRPEGGPRP